MITRIQRFSLHDGPGIRATVFFKGCPLACVWCQNPETMIAAPEVLFFHDRCVECKKCVELCPTSCFSYNEKINFKSDTCNQCGVCIDNCPVSALTWSAKGMTPDEILIEVMQDMLYYELSGGGITFSGGEPLYQPEFCLELASRSKTLGLHVTLDTSGYATSDTLDKIMPHVDLFLYDIKFIDNALHERYTGRSNDVILENFLKICAANQKIVVRVPLIPNVTDTEKNLSEIREFLRDNAANVEINYIPFNKLIKQKYSMLGRTCLVS